MALGLKHHQNTQITGTGLDLRRGTAEKNEKKNVYCESMLILKLMKHEQGAEQAEVNDRTGEAVGLGGLGEGWWRGRGMSTGNSEAWREN